MGPELAAGPWSRSKGPGSMVAMAKGFFFFFEWSSQHIRHKIDSDEFFWIVIICILGHLEYCAFEQCGNVGWAKCSYRGKMDARVISRSKTELLFFVSIDDSLESSGGPSECQGSLTSDSRFNTRDELDQNKGAQN